MTGLQHAPGSVGVEDSPAGEHDPHPAMRWLQTRWAWVVGDDFLGVLQWLFPFQGVIANFSMPSSWFANSSYAASFDRVSCGGR